MSSERNIPDEPTLEEAKALCMELLPTCPKHGCVMVRKGYDNPMTGKGCHYTYCPTCGADGMIEMEFTSGLPVDNLLIEFTVDEKGAHVSANASVTKTPNA